MTAQLVLDRVQSIGASDTLAAAPDVYLVALAGELPAVDSLAGHAARDAVLASALGRIDELATRVMRLRLDHALVADASLPPPTRRVFAATVVNYHDTMPLLAARVRDLAARGHAHDPDAVAAAVVEAARATLALRDQLRAGVLALVRDLATAAIPDADACARDRHRDEGARRQWGRVRRDLEVLASEPARILAAPHAARLAAWPDELDEPVLGPAPTLAELIELD